MDAKGGMCPRLVRVCPLLLVGAVGMVLLAAGAGWGSPVSSSPYLKEYEILVDSTGLTPQTRWHVPGVTPIISSLDPDTTDAYSTTERHIVKLKPGMYRFGTFTFDFPFAITLDGILDFSNSLDQCVEGRGTRRLTVRCSRTQPYSGQPDY